MSLFAISDLHLSFSPDVDKPMDNFGSRWVNHASRLKENWEKIIRPCDTVIIPGDISWGLKLDEAMPDLEWVDSLPGRKIMLKGNHDLWWTSIKKLNSSFETISFLQNDCIYAEGVYICGSRGWITPDNDDFTDADDKIYKRELLRLEMSLESARSCQKEQPGEILGIMHFPPVTKVSRFSGFQQIFMDYGVRKVIYGHIHGEDGFRSCIKGDYHGTDYQLVSLDYLNCMPAKIR